MSVNRHSIRIDTPSTAPLAAMKIAIVAPVVAPIVERDAHGNHHVLVDLARGLEKRGHDVAVFCAEGSSVPGVRLVTLPIDKDVRRRTVIPGRELAADARDAGDALGRAYRALFERVADFGPNAVSQHAYDAEAIEAAGSFRAVHTLHLPPILPEVVRACVATEQRLGAVSRDAQSRWHAVGVDAGLLRNGVPDPLDGRDLPTRAERDPAAIIAGRISPEKGTAVAIRAAGRAGLRADVVGSVHDPDYYATQVEPLLKSGFVNYRGAITRAELSELLLNAEVAIMPVEWDEPFGLVAADAQMVGCPVVAYNRGALPEIVEHGVGGWIVPAGEESALVGAAAAASSLPREEIRESAVRRLGLEPMLDAYEETLAAAADEDLAPAGSPQPDVAAPEAEDLSASTGTLRPQEGTTFR